MSTNLDIQDLRKAYLLVYNGFAVIPQDLVDALDNVNLRYARQLLGDLVKHDIVAVTDVNDEQDVWQTYPDSHDSIDEAEALARFDTAYNTKEGTTAMSTNTEAPATTPTQCRCGCNEQVPAKSFYRPGHDARHAGQVGRRIAANYATKGYDRRVDLEALPSERLRAKAEGIAEKATERAEAKLQREAEREQRKAAKSSPTVDAGNDGTEETEHGTVKVGKNEYAAVRYTATGEVEYFVGDVTKTASKTAKRTFSV